MVYCTSLHFLRHEQWRTDGTGSEKHHVVWTWPAQVHHIKQTYLKSEQVSGYGPGAPMSQKRTKLVVSVACCFQHSASAVSTSYSIYFFLYKLFKLWILSSAPCIQLFEEGVDFFFFKEYGCSKTERIRKWSGVLSNALLRVHYKDE